MPNFLDSIKQYISGFGSPAVYRGGPGYVAEEVDNRFKPSASPESYRRTEEPYTNTEPEVSPVSNLLSGLKDMFSQPKVIAAERSLEEQAAEQAALQEELTSLGWTIPGNEPVPGPVAEPLYPDSGMSEYIQGQRSSGIDPAAQQYLESTLLPLTRELGIPDSVAASQWAIEGGRNQMANPFGMLRGGELIPYQTLDEAVSQGYDLTLRDLVSRNAGVPYEDFSYSDFTPEDLIKFLQYSDQEGQDVINPQDPGYGTPGVARTRYEAHSPLPFEYLDLLTSTPEWRQYR